MSVRIQKLSLKGDFITILNVSNDPQDISEWKIRSLVGNQEFNFPPNTILYPGASTTVWAGKDADKKDHPPHSFLWKKSYIWNDAGDAASLEDKNGSVIDRVEEKPPQFKFRVEILELHLKGDYVTVINQENHDVDLSKWVLKSAIGGQTFTFPSGTILKSGTTITVWSGRHSDPKHCPPSVIHWTNQHVWNDAGDTAVLYNSTGDLISKVQQVPVKVPDHINSNNK